MSQNKPLVKYAILLVASVTFTTSFPGDAFAKEHIVKALSGGSKDMRFEPQDLDVKVGDKVTWINDADIYHNVKALDKDIPAGATPMKSPGLKKRGESWTYEFKVAGKYNYFCVPHRAMGMVGSVTASK